MKMLSAARKDGPVSPQVAYSHQHHLYQKWDLQGESDHHAAAQILLPTQRRKKTIQLGVAGHTYVKLKGLVPQAKKWAGYCSQPARRNHKQ